MWTHLFVHNNQCCYVRSCGEHTTVRRGFNHVSFSFVKLSPNLYCSKGLIARGMALQLWMRWWKRLGCSPFLFCAAWHSQSPDCHQCQKVAHTQQGILSGAHWWDETGWLLHGLKWNEKQMSWRVTESVCVLSARPTWVMALIWPPAPQLFIIRRWQGGAGKRRGLGAPSWSITLEVSFPSYLTATWITAALVYRRKPIWMNSRRRKQFLCSLYQRRWVIGRMDCATSFPLYAQAHSSGHKKAKMYTNCLCAPVCSRHRYLLFLCVK